MRILIVSAANNPVWTAEFNQRGTAKADPP
jgi:hypothetical protein